MLTASFTFGRMRNVVQIIHTMLCGGIAVFIGVAWYLKGKLDTAKSLDATMLTTVGAVLSVSAIAIALVLPMFANKYLAGRPIESRMRNVVFTSILVAATLEAAALFWTVVSLLLQDVRFLICSGVCLALMVALFPTQAKLETTLGLSEEQIDRALAARASP
ncbi:MAG: hypothetical protein IPH13_02035 [Planctomycetes bacterium]|nr:hypothetical protein [Planctomycetota bacterium]MCC7169509.1 hypothetical protein [Planctomycetota bacterium]